MAIVRLLARVLHVATVQVMKHAVLLRVMVRVLLVQVLLVVVLVVMKHAALRHAMVLVLRVQVLLVALAAMSLAASLHAMALVHLVLALRVQVRARHVLPARVQALNAAQPAALLKAVVTATVTAISGKKLGHEPLFMPILLLK
jgi:hypothetical protein